MAYPAVSQGDGVVQAQRSAQPIPLFPEQEHEPQVLGDYQVSGPGIVQMAFHAVGAVVSLALICGGVWWGYSQIMRDVQGVPVVRALEGPYRVAPETPGGKVASHEGLSVNAVQAVGVASNPETSLQLAPAPIDLAEEDKPSSELSARPEPRPEVAAASAPARADPEPGDMVQPQPASLTMDVPASDERAEALAAVQKATNGVPPLSETPQTAPETGLVPASVPGPNRTIRPPRRPERPSSVVLASTSNPGNSTIADAIARAVAEAANVSEIVAVPVGTRLVQLGTFDNAADATAAWDGISRKFAGLMDGKQKILGEGRGGGREFWRLRAMGFQDLAEARRFCAALLAEGTDCIPVTAR